MNVHAQFWFFATCDFFVSSVLLLKGKPAPLLNHKKTKSHGKRDQLLILKMETNHQISQRNKSFTY